MKKVRLGNDSGEIEKQKPPNLLSRLRGFICGDQSKIKGWGPRKLIKNQSGGPWKLIKNQKGIDVGN